MPISTNGISCSGPFLGWTGTGSGSYTGPNAQSHVTMNGNITEVANFGVTTTTTTTTTTTLTIDTTSVPTTTVSQQGSTYIFSGLIGSVLNQGIQLNSPQSTKSIQYNNLYGFPDSTSTLSSPYSAIGYVPLSTAVTPSNGGGVSFSSFTSLNAGNANILTFDNLFQISAPQLSGLKYGYGPHGEYEYLWLTGFPVYDQQSSVNSFELMDAGGAYEANFTQPILNRSTASGSGQINVPIYLLGQNYTLVNGTGTTSRYSLGNGSQTVPGGQIYVAPSTGMRTVYVNQNLSWGPWTVQVQDLAQVGNATNAPAAVAVYYSGQETNESSIEVGQTAKFNVSGHLLFINVNSSFSGVYAYQKWATIQVYTNPMKLQNGRAFNQSQNPGWYATLLWTNTTPGSTKANMLDGIIVYNSTPTSLMPNQSLQFIGGKSPYTSSSAYWVTFLGDTHDNYDPLTLQSSANYGVNYANTGTRYNLPGVPYISNITEPAQELTVTSQIPNAFSYAGQTGSSVTYDLTPYVLNEYATLPMARGSNSVVTLRYVDPTATSGRTAWISNSTPISVTIVGYAQTTNTYTTQSVTFTGNASNSGGIVTDTANLYTPLRNVTAIQIQGNRALPIFGLSSLNISVSTNSIVLASLNGTSIQTFLYSIAGQNYLAVANAVNAQGGAYYNQQTGQPSVPFYLSHGDGVHTLPFVFVINEYPVPSVTGSLMDSFSIGLSAKPGQSSYLLNQSITGVPYNVSYTSSQTYFGNTSSQLVNAGIGFRSEKGSRVASIAPNQDVFDMATGVDQLQFEVQSQSVGTPVKITNYTTTVGQFGDTFPLTSQQSCAMDEPTGGYASTEICLANPANLSRGNEMFMMYHNGVIVNTITISPNMNQTVMANNMFMNVKLLNGYYNGANSWGVNVSIRDNTDYQIDEGNLPTKIGPWTLNLISSSPSLAIVTIGYGNTAPASYYITQGTTVSVPGSNSTLYLYVTPGSGYSYTYNGNVTNYVPLESWYTVPPASTRPANLTTRFTESGLPNGSTFSLTLSGASASLTKSSVVGISNTISFSTNTSFTSLSPAAVSYKGATYIAAPPGWNLGWNVTIPYAKVPSYKPYPNAINMSQGANVTSGPWKIALLVAGNTGSAVEGSFAIFHNGQLTNETVFSAGQPAQLFNVNGSKLYIKALQVGTGQYIFQNSAAIVPSYAFNTVTVGHSMSSGPWTVQLQDLAQTKTGTNAPAAIAVYYNGKLTNESTASANSIATFQQGSDYLYVDINLTFSGLYAYQKWAQMQLWHS